MSARAPQRLSELSAPARELASLVPGVYLARNEEIDGRPLFVLLEVLARPLADLEAAIVALHDDHFVERASAEALPLLGDLVGARLLTDDPRTTRAVVARTLHWRRRKGSLATLEDVLTLTSGWSTEADEGFRSLLVTQDLAHLVPWRGRDAVLWDPITLADPLSRRAPLALVPRPVREADVVAREPDESVEDALRRLGAADAGRPAVSPRTVDLIGWARPDQVVLRSSRVVSVELDEVELTGGRPVPHRHDPAVAYVGYPLDPLGRPLPLAGRVGVERPTAADGLTAAHEPDEGPPPEHLLSGMLTPTELASRDAAAARSDDLTVLVDDVALVGLDRRVGAGDDLAFAPVGPEPLLRLADAGRPSPADRWRLELLALETGGEVPLVTTVVRRGGRDPEVVAPEASIERGGATVAIGISRPVAGVGYRRDAAGQWTTVDVGQPAGSPRSDVAVLDAPGPGRAVVRLEAGPGGELQLGVWRADQASQWAAHALDLSALPGGSRPDPDGAKEGPSMSAIGVGAELFLVGPAIGSGEAGAQPLGIWRVADPLGGAAVLTRFDADQDGPRAPTGRMVPALCHHGGRLVVFGGEHGTERGPQHQGELASDVWSVALTGADAGRWMPHFVRNRQWRVGGRLLSAPGGLVLVGGASELGALDTTVWRADLTRTRPTWEELPPLPVDAGRPGTAWARADGDAVEALVWADRVAPRRMRLEAGARAWATGAPERDAPNPPAEDEAVFDGEDLLAVGAPPLPPSEVVFRIGGRGRVAFLPAIDLGVAADRLVFRVRDDGSTERVRAPGEPDRRSLRLGAGRDASTGTRGEAAERLSAPGRLGWRPLQVRQVNLEPWDRPFALDLDDVVGADPRLGRVLLRDELAGGRVSASFRVARAAGIGAGFTARARAVPDAWQEPPDPDDPRRFAVPVPPDLDAGRVEGRAPTTAWVSPRRAGLTGAGGVPIVARLGPAVALGTDVVSVGVLGSPVLPPDVLTLAQSAVATVWAADDRTLPHLEDDDGVSLVLSERLQAAGGGGDGAPADGDDPDRGPTWFLSGLSTAGMVELAVAAGQLDLRWCSLAAPGGVALRVAGAGHQPPLLRHSIPRSRVRVRLYGCQLGRVEVPPWVELVAAGCTFDAGDRDAVAIAAAGASVRLRHCTVNGRSDAGRFEATSSVMAGPVTCDRPDLSFTRYSLVAPGGRPPLSFRSISQRPSFASMSATSPYHLALAGNNGAAASAAAEHGLTPGAHHDRAPRHTELTARADDFLPLALAPFHVDRTAGDLHRTHRRTG